MLTITPHLHTRRPSPTTVQYTVANTPPGNLSHRLLLLSTFLLRILVGLSTLLLLHSKWILSIYSTPLLPNDFRPPFLSTSYLWYCLTTIHNSSLGTAFAHISTLVSTPVLLPVAVLALYGTIVRVYTEESLLVLRGLGIQTSTSSGTYLSSASTRFIPTDKIQDVLVNEAFRGFEVRYYLVVLVKGEGEVVVVFPQLLPRRVIVEAVWRGARACLYEPQGDAGKVVDANG